MKKKWGRGFGSEGESEGRAESDERIRWEKREMNNFVFLVYYSTNATWLACKINNGDSSTPYSQHTTCVNMQKSDHNSLPRVLLID